MVSMAARRISPQDAAWRNECLINHHPGNNTPPSLCRMCQTLTRTLGEISLPLPPSPAAAIDLDLICSYVSAWACRRARELLAREWEVRRKKGSLSGPMCVCVLAQKCVDLSHLDKDGDTFQTIAILNWVILHLFPGVCLSFTNKLTWQLNYN